MRIFKGVEDFKAKNVVATVGTFDGVHKGHLEVINTLKKHAKLINGETVIFTFWPHPRTVVGDATGVSLLNTIEEKIKLFESYGIDNVIVYPFTKEFSQLSSEEFVNDILVKKVGIKVLVLGYDHQFGKNREGSYEKIKHCADKYGFEAVRVEALGLEGKNISSTKIRAALDAGDFKTVRSYLGYNYSLTGTVIHGHKKGRLIGFPTANIELNNSMKLVPGNGVYAVNVIDEGVTYNGMLNIGVKPTITDENIRTLEVNIFDYNKDVYGNTLTIELIEKIRDEVKFSDFESLKQQIAKDKVLAAEILCR